MSADRRLRAEKSGDSWALRKGERPRGILVKREPRFVDIEENAVYRTLAYVEHVRSRRTRLRSNEYFALFFVAVFGLVPLLLGFWAAAPVAAVLVGSIYFQARARQRSEALGHFFKADRGVLKDLMMAGLPAREWSIALWARHVTNQQPYWILGFNVLLLVSCLGGAVWATPFWIHDKMVPILFSAIAFSYMFFIAWYNARLRYLPWSELPSVVFQPKAYRLGYQYLKRIPLQIDQARVALLTQVWVFAIIAGAFGCGRLILMAEASGRLVGWRESLSYTIVAFPPIWLGPGLFFGSLAGMLWGVRCERRAEVQLEKLDEEVGRLLELIRQRTESDEI